MAKTEKSEKENTIRAKSEKLKSDKEKSERDSQSQKKRPSILDKGRARSLKVRKDEILIISGEHSGDLLGADVVHYLKRLGYENFFGTGGMSMQKEGVDLLASVDSMAVMGFVEALKAYKRLKQLALSIVDEAVKRKTSLAVLIDYPGFNLRIAAMLKEKGIPVIFLVSPQIWAWKYGRIESIRKNIDLMLVLFTFEKEIYDREKIPCKLIGHPLVKRLPIQLRNEERLHVKGKPVIALLPGSRPGEIKKLLPVMIASARLIKESFPHATFVIPNINKDSEGFIISLIEKNADLSLVYAFGQSLRAMEASELVILSSGTATLETTLMNKPMIIVYKVGWINFFLAGILMRCRYVGLVNLLSRKQAALELLQTEATPENIFHETKRILSDSSYRKSILEELDFVSRQLGKGNPALNAAKAIQEFLTVK